MAWLKCPPSSAGGATCRGGKDLLNRQQTHVHALLTQVQSTQCYLVRESYLRETAVYGVAVGHEHQPVQLVEQPAGGLVDGGDDGTAVTRQAT